MPKRFQTYFNVPVPPWKEEKIGAGSATIRFVITGKVPSKKNNLQSVAVRKDARRFLNEQQAKNGQITLQDAHKAVRMCYSKVRPNKEYDAFLAKVKPIILSQAAIWSDRLGDKGLIFPLTKASLNLHFYFNNRYITDTVNKQQTIQDLLISCGIIADDDYKSLNPIHAASACYVDELVESIAFISLSFRL